MTVPDQYKGKYFFHFTHLNNLQEILTHGLLSTNEKEAESIDHLDVASPDIQCTRHEMEVTCGPKGHVHDYVPFYFSPRTPMFLSLIKSRNYDQHLFMFFAVSIEKLNGKNFLFTDKAANRRNTPPNFYESPTDLDKLNWSSIRSNSWGSRNDDEKHQKMAEALHYGKFDISDVSYIVVWRHKSYKEYVENLFENENIKCPPVFYDNSYGYNHYYYDFNYNPNASLIHGPISTLKSFKKIVGNIKEKRKLVLPFYLFDDMCEMLEDIRNDFSSVKELKGIMDLPTDNKVHSEDVESHTRTVVKNLVESEEFKSLNEREKTVVEFSAFLHDVGKGPKSRWPNGKQKVDDDHPRKSAVYIERILVEDINSISRKEIRQVVFLVMYHDFFGDHLVYGRYLNELSAVLKSKSDLNMLYALAKADVLSINARWYNDRILYWEEAREKLMERL